MNFEDRIVQPTGYNPPSDPRSHVPFIQLTKEEDKLARDSKVGGRAFMDVRNGYIVKFYDRWDDLSGYGVTDEEHQAWYRKMGLIIESDGGQFWQGLLVTFYDGSSLVEVDHINPDLYKNQLSTR
jgi:hypothetical protein